MTQDELAARRIAGGNAEGGPRPDTRVPANGIPTIQRRIKRKLYKYRGVVWLTAATLLGITVLSERTPQPNLTAFNLEIAAGQAIDTYAGGRVANVPPGVNEPKLHAESKLHAGSGASPGPEAGKVSERPENRLTDDELVEMERLLVRLDLGPSMADGIVDNQTAAAIRLYQEIAGLPVDGAPSRTLLADIREVVKILEGGG